MSSPPIGSIYKDVNNKYYMTVESPEHVKDDYFTYVTTPDGGIFPLTPLQFDTFIEVSRNTSLESLEHRDIKLKILVNSSTQKNTSTNKPKILVIGHARHGKDTFAQMLGIPYESSSEAALKIFLFDQLNYIRTHIWLTNPYKTSEEAFKDRVNHRALWHKEISRYNKQDRAKLAKGIMANNDCYVGMRCDKELAECIKIGLFDEIFWVDASKRYPPEPRDSFSINYDEKTMNLIQNNGSKWLLQLKVYYIRFLLFLKY